MKTNSKRTVLMAVSAGLLAALMVFSVAQSTVFAAQALMDTSPTETQTTETSTPDPSVTPSVSPTPEVTETPAPSGAVEARGVVEAVSDTSITVNGQVYAITSSTEMKGSIAVGDTVKVEAYTADDGTLTASEIQGVVTNPGQGVNHADDHSALGTDIQHGKDDVAHQEHSPASRHAQDDHSSSSSHSQDSHSEDHSSGSGSGKAEDSGHKSSGH